METIAILVGALVIVVLAMWLFSFVSGVFYRLTKIKEAKDILRDFQKDMVKDNLPQNLTEKFRDMRSCLRDAKADYSALGITLDYLKSFVWENFTRIVENLLSQIAQEKDLDKRTELIIKSREVLAKMHSDAFRELEFPKEELEKFKRRIDIVGLRLDFDYLIGKADQSGYDVATRLDNLMAKLRESNLTLEDINLTQADLDERRKTYYQAEMRNAYQRALDCSAQGQVNEVINTLCNWQSHSGIAFEEIKFSDGSHLSQAKIDAVLRAGYFAEAKKSLQEARSKSAQGENVSQIIFKMRKLLNLAGKTPYDLPVLEDEISHMLARVYLKHASRYLQKAREAHASECILPEVEEMRRNLQIASLIIYDLRGEELPIEAIGTSEAEIKRLLTHNGEKSEQD